jgi:hypothetical protein
MKTVLISMFSGALMLGVAAAQNGAPPMPGSQSSEPQTTAPANAPARIAPGSVIPVSLTKTIDAKKVKTGDEVVAKVTQDMKNTTGQVIVAKDTEVIGHVTEAQPRTKEQKESQVGIAFDHAVMKNGSQMQLPMSIQAIIGPQNNQNSGGGNGEQAAAAPGPGASPSSPRPGGMGGGSTASQVPSAPTGSGGMPSDTQTATTARPPITAQTQGVVGISNLKLTTTAPTANQGSLVSSEKNNVKLESGTLMLLRVNQ